MTGPFHPTAHLYDAFYAHLDYEAAATTVAETVRERCPGAASLLDVACGTGRHLETLERTFEHCEGADIDPAMLEIARERLPEVPLHVADMETLDLGRTFDAVICMFSSIGYAATSERMRAAVRAMAAHLGPGGVLVVEPWLWPDMITPPLVRVQTAEAEDLVIARTTRTRVRGGATHMEFAYLVTTEEGSQTFTEEHVMGLFTPDEYTAAIGAAGLDAEFLMPGPIGRGMAVGTAPRSAA
ncbi:MAG: methyltransferase domain-containing protein [Actinobacteria bacterium]|nr:methyltransferase domain-containing protein [Actinomycetota bacterium]